MGQIRRYDVSGGVTGRCHCGRVTYKSTLPVNWSCYCHCEDCRRSTGSVAAAFIGIDREAFEWTGDIPKIYNSSKGVRRHFCPTCGTPMAFDADHYDTEIHLYTGTLDHPEDAPATFSVYAGEKLPWVHLDEGLKAYSKSGSGEEY